MWSLWKRGKERLKGGGRRPRASAALRSGSCCATAARPGGAAKKAPPPPRGDAAGREGSMGGGEGGGKMGHARHRIHLEGPGGPARIEVRSPHLSSRDPAWPAWLLDEVDSAAQVLRRQEALSWHPACLAQMRVSFRLLCVSSRSRMTAQACLF